MPEGVGKENAKAEARSLKPVERYYFNCIVRGGDGLPKIYSCGKTVKDIILKAMVGDDGEPALGDCSHPVTGRDFKVVKVVKGGAYPDYAQSKFLAVSPLGTPEEIARYLDGRYDLQQLRQVKPYSEMYLGLQAHYGKGVPADETDNADLAALSQPVISSSVSLADDATDDDKSAGLNLMIDQMFGDDI